MKPVVMFHYDRYGSLGAFHLGHVVGWEFIDNEDIREQIRVELTTGNYHWILLKDFKDFLDRHTDYLERLK